MTTTDQREMTLTPALKLLLLLSLLLSSSCNELGHRIAANTCVTGAHLRVVAAKWSF